MTDRTYNDRVDDTILVGSLRLARFRKKPIRSLIEGHRIQCIENGRESEGTDMVDYWRHRVTRCEQLLENPDDRALYRMAETALDREEGRIR